MTSFSPATKSISTSLSPRILILDTGLRMGEALSLEWRDVHLDPSGDARFGYIRIRDGKSRNAKREVIKRSAKRLAKHI